MSHESRNEWHEEHFLQASPLRLGGTARPVDPKVEKWLQAAERGDLAAVVDFLESGIDVNAGNAINTTVLMRAVRGRPPRGDPGAPRPRGVPEPAEQARPHGRNGRADPLPVLGAYYKIPLAPP